MGMVAVDWRVPPQPPRKLRLLGGIPLGVGGLLLLFSGGGTLLLLTTGAFKSVRQGVYVPSVVTVPLCLCCQPRHATACRGVLFAGVSRPRMSWYNGWLRARNAGRAVRLRLAALG